MKNNIAHFKTLKPEAAYQEAITKIESINSKNKISLSVMPFAHHNNSTSNLNGVIYSLKDNIATKGHTTTGASKFLENYVPEYDATLKTLLDNAGAICVSKDNLDEFGLGGTGLFSGYGLVANPFDNKRISGGSSSGSACMVSQNIVPFAICTDTGDSIRKPASFQGIVGFKPTYGAISRYGVYPYAPSLDHVGIMAHTVEDIAQVFSVIAKQDDNDMTSIDLSSDYLKNLKPNKTAKLVVLKDALDHMESGEQKEFKTYLDKLVKQGFNIAYEEFGVKLLQLIDPIYKSISYGEASTCWANLSGILFGMNKGGKNYEDIIMNNRTEFFGRQLKRRFVIGSLVTSKEYYEDVFNASKKVRTLIINRANELFKKYDAILMPGASRIAPLIEDELNHKPTCNICDDALQIANFGGLPSITVPAIKYNNLFVGINITCPLKQDQNTLNIAQAIMEVEHE